jgi:hypothetical protein
MTDLFFLPTLRRGLVGQVTATDPGEGAIGPAEVPMGLTVAGTEISKAVHLLAPHHVASIAPDQIVRRYPVPGATDVETNYFPLIELGPPDLPWRYTPAAPGTHDRLRPWIALVVVEEGVEGIAFIGAPGAVGRLSVSAEQLHQLPPADELWGWAHVQSSRPVDEVEAAVVDAPETLRSRLICPRRVDPGRTYRVALVNTFVAGAGDRSEPAWTADGTAPVDLVVHDTWTFTTSATVGDFEYLCELLEPAADVGPVGVRSVDVSEPGIDVAWPTTPMSVDLVGALADPGLVDEPTPPGTAEFTTVVEPILDAVLGRADDRPDGPRYDALEDDPVVGLPFYGSWPAEASRVPDAGWARALNLRTTRRMAAGLGARTVRHNQESLMAAAWDQLGSIREAADELNRGRLSAEVGRSWQARLAAVEAGDRLALAAPLLTFITVFDTPARRMVEASEAPSVLIDRAWLRRAPRARAASAANAYVDATRPDATPVARRAFAFQAVATAMGITPLDTQLDVEDRSTDLLDAEAIDYVNDTGLATLIGGATLSDFVLQRRVVGPIGPLTGESAHLGTDRPDGRAAGRPPGGAADRTGAGAADHKAGPASGRPADRRDPARYATGDPADRDVHVPAGRPADRPAGRTPTREVPPATGPTGPLDLPGHDGPIDFPLPPIVGSVIAVAEAVASLDPLLSMRASLVARIPALGDLLPAGELPAELTLAPEFADPLFWDLSELDDDVIVPGLGEFPNNRVRLLAVNPGFVGAYLVGANHEMAREFLWREYPTDLAATFFARFFDYGSDATVDIEPIAGWPDGSSIGANLPNAATTTVILVRGDLIRRYPEVNMFLVPRGAGGKPDYTDAVQPSFEGRLGDDALVVGFPVAPDVVLGRTGGAEHYVVFEERVVAPRFGLDVERTPPGPLTTWDELAWTDFPGADHHIGVGPIPGLGKPDLDTVVWGRNAAHLAAAVHQRPFRRLYLASTLVAAP